MNVATAATIIHVDPQKSSELHSETSPASASRFRSCTAKVHIDDLVRFLFPSHLQHALAAGRLFVYGLYGPLDEQLQLRTGPQKRNVVSDWQMDLMCIQVEREDILSIYMHKNADVAMLTSDEQEQIISQADKHLKSAKGRAMMPPLSRDDIYDMFKNLKRDENGMVEFNEVQETILNFRAKRIANFKRVFPKLTVNNDEDSGNAVNTRGKASIHSPSGIKRRPKRGKVSQAVAPATMFMHMKGSNNADIILTTNRYLNQFASKISDIDGGKAGSSATANVRLLREVEPCCPDPYIKSDGTMRRPLWDNTSQLTGTGLGSMVKVAASSTTWKRNTTIAEK